jgi:hypothetical protein
LRFPTVAAPAFPPATPFPSGVRFAKTIIGDAKGNLDLLRDFPNASYCSKGDARNLPASHPSPPSSIPREPRSIAQEAAIDKGVPFSYFSFLESTGLARLPASEVKYLESEGCFKLPCRPHLDNFVREYFLHVHPCMPVVDEADIWLAFEQEGVAATGVAKRPKISLLLFQAMLFAASRVGPAKGMNGITQC